MVQDLITLDVLDHSAFGLGVFDLKTGEIVWSNRSLKNLTWFGNAEGGKRATKVHYLNLFFEDDHSVIKQLMDICLSAGSAYDTERKMRKGQKRQFIGKIKFIAVKGKDSEEITHFLLEVVDLSLEKLYNQLKKQEEQLRSLQGKLTTILDHVHSGFMLINEQGIIQDGHSKGCSAVFDREIQTGELIQDILGLESRNRNQFEMAVSQVFDDFLPEEVSLIQIPDSHILNQKHIQLETEIVRNAEGEPMFLLMTASDVTEMHKTAEEVRSNKALLYIMKQRASFERLLEEFHKILSAENIPLVASSEKQARRILHTLKGNFSLFGLQEIVKEIHEIEEKDKIHLDDFYQIKNSLANFLKEHQDVLNMRFDGKSDTIQVKRDQINELMNLVAKNQSDHPLKNQVKTWIDKLNLVAAKEMFNPFQNLVERVAARLTKKVEFEVLNPDIEILPNDFNGVFEVFPLLLTNAIDHGIEHPLDRGDKPKTGKITLEIEAKNNTWFLTLSDDGKGIDANALRKKAIKDGYLSEEEALNLSDQDAIKLIFDEKFTTREKASEFSGRGFGMAAVKEKIESSNGKIEVQTEIGKGSIFVFQIPKSN